MSAPRKLAALLFALFLPVAASPLGATPVAAEGPTLEIRDFAFPTQVAIGVGESVTWVNTEQLVPHDVVSGAPGGPDAGQAFASALLQPGQAFSLPFTEVGTYEYFCSLHPGMRGIVVVSGGSTELPPAAPSE